MCVCVCVYMYMHTCRADLLLVVVVDCALQGEQLARLLQLCYGVCVSCLQLLELTPAVCTPGGGGWGHIHV